MKAIVLKPIPGTNYVPGEEHEFKGDLSWLKTGGYIEEIKKPKISTEPERQTEQKTEKAK